MKIHSHLTLNGYLQHDYVKFGELNDMSPLPRQAKACLLLVLRRKLTAFQYKVTIIPVQESHYDYKIISPQSYLYNGNLYTLKDGPYIETGAWGASQYKYVVLPVSIRIPILKIRWSHDHLIFNMGIPYGALEWYSLCPVRSQLDYPLGLRMKGPAHGPAGMSGAALRDSMETQYGDMALRDSMENSIGTQHGDSIVTAWRDSIERQHGIQYGDTAWRDNMETLHGDTAWRNNMKREHGETTLRDSMETQHGETTWRESMERQH